MTSKMSEAGCPLAVAEPEGHKCADGKVSGFTLVELLVVIGIIALLAAILLPAVTKMLQKAEIATAKSDIGRIVSAWENYYREYGRWPVGPPGQRLFSVHSQAPNQDAAEGGTGMRMLMGVMTNIMYPSGEFATGGGTWYMNMNPICTNYNGKRIHFMTYNTEVVDVQGSMVDPWGNAYWFLFDLNKDGRVQRGGAVATSVYASVMVWSLGADAVLSTDDVKSWE